MDSVEEELLTLFLECQNARHEFSADVLFNSPCIERNAFGCDQRDVVVCDLEVDSEDGSTCFRNQVIIFV